MNAELSPLTCAGLVIRVRPLTETSLIVHWVTRELGRLATVAKGAQRPTSPFRGKLDLFYLAEMTLRRARKSQLHTLTEVKVLEVSASLREDWHRLRQAAYAAALVEEATETDTPIPELFELLLSFVRTLGTSAATLPRMLAFEIRTLQLLGFDPSRQPGPLSAGHRDLLASMTKLELAAADTLQFQARQGEQLTRFLHGCLAECLHRIPKSRIPVYRTLLGQRE